MGSGHLGTVLTREVLDDVARYGPEQVVNFAALTGKWAVVAAVANCALPKVHALKIPWDDVHQRRSGAVTARNAVGRYGAAEGGLDLQEARADAAFFRTLAPKLQAFLPNLFDRKCGND